MKGPRKEIVERLRAIPDAFDIDAAELCRRIKIRPTAWANYVSPTGKRIITIDVACKVCNEFNLTLDWVYCGKTALISSDFLKKIRRKAA